MHTNLNIDDGVSPTRCLSRFEGLSPLKASFFSALLYACVLIIIAAFFFHFRFEGSPSYGRAAFDLLQKGSFDSGYRPPLYPELLASCISFFGDKWTLAALAIQIFFGAFCCGATIFLACRAGRSVTVGAVAAVLWMLDVPLHLEMLKQRETSLFIALQMLAALIVLETKNGWMRAILIGLVAALAHLTRPDCIVPIVFLFALLLLPDAAKLHRFSTKATKQFCCGLLVFCLSVWPWQHAINKMSHKFNIGSATMLGPNLWKGNNPYFWQFYPAIEIDAIQDVMRVNIGMSPAAPVEVFEASPLLLEQAKAYIRSDPAGFVIRSIGKAALFFSPIPLPYSNGEIVKNGEGIRIVSQKFISPGLFVLYTVFSLIIFFGLYLFLRRWQTHSPYAHVTAIIFLLSLGLNVGLHAIMFPESRFRLPLEPFFVICAAIAFARYADSYWGMKEN